MGVFEVRDRCSQRVIKAITNNGVQRPWLRIDPNLRRCATTSLRKPISYSAPNVCLGHSAIGLA